jgi:hypothetical protein
LADVGIATLSVILQKKCDCVDEILKTYCYFLMIKNETDTLIGATELIFIVYNAIG